MITSVICGSSSIFSGEMLVLEGKTFRQGHAEQPKDMSGSADPSCVRHIFQLPNIINHSTSSPAGYDQSNHGNGDSKSVEHRGQGSVRSVLFCSSKCGSSANRPFESGLGKARSVMILLWKSAQRRRLELVGPSRPPLKRIPHSDARTVPKGGTREGNRQR